MLTLWSARAECLWDESLPIEVREPPEDVRALDRVLSDPALMARLLERFRRELLQTGRRALDEGRRTIGMETFISFKT